MAAETPLDTLNMTRRDALRALLLSGPGAAVLAACGAIPQAGGRTGPANEWRRIGCFGAHISSTRGSAYLRAAGTGEKRRHVARCPAD